MSFHFFFLFLAKLEFALIVLKPEPQTEPPDQLFLLAPTVIQKEDIQVSRHAVFINSALMGGGAIVFMEKKWLFTVITLC